MAVVNPPFVSADGQRPVGTIGVQNTYSLAGSVTVAATPTDVVALSNPANSGKTLSVLLATVSGTSTAVQNALASLLKRSTLNTGGTSTTPTPVPHDSLQGAASGVVNLYTANPTAGTSLGAVRERVVGFVAPTGNGEGGLIADFTTRNDKPIVLHPGESLCVNLGGATISGMVLAYEFCWFEV